MFYPWWIIAVYVIYGAYLFSKEHDEAMGAHRPREHVHILLCYMILWGPAEVAAWYKIHKRGAGKE